MTSQEIIFKPKFSLWNLYTMGWTPSYLRYFYRREMDCVSNNAVKREVWMKKDRCLSSPLILGAFAIPFAVMAMSLLCLLPWTVFMVHLLLVSEPTRIDLLRSARYRRSVEEDLKNRFVPVCEG